MPVQTLIANIINVELPGYMDARIIVEILDISGPAHEGIERRYQARLEAGGQIAYFGPNDNKKTVTAVAWAELFERYIQKELTQIF